MNFDISFLIDWTVMVDYRTIIRQVRPFVKRHVVKLICLIRINKLKLLGFWIIFADAHGFASARPDVFKGEFGPTAATVSGPAGFRPGVGRAAVPWPIPHASPPDGRGGGN